MDASFHADVGTGATAAVARGSKGQFLAARNLHSCTYRLLIYVIQELAIKSSSQMGRNTATPGVQRRRWQ